MELNMQKTEAEEILRFLADSGKINLNDVAGAMKQTYLDKILSIHPYPITRGADGRWRTYVKPSDGKRKMIARATEEKVHEALIVFYESGDFGHKKEVSLEILYPKWCEYKELHGAAPANMKRIQSNWKTFYKGTAIVKKPIKELSKIELDVWAHKLIEDVHHSKKEYYNVSLLMRQILDYAVELEIVKENLLRQVKINAKMVFLPVKKKTSESQVFTKDEVEALYDVAWNEFEADTCTVHKLTPLAVMFQFQTGVRIGELCALRYEDIIDSEIYVQRMYRHEEHDVVPYTKAHNTGRYVPLTYAAKNLIQQAKSYQQENNLPDDGYIFSVNKVPLSYYAVRKAYQRYCDKIGTINKSSHKSRKTFISALIDGGVNINEIREIVGHADERTTFSSYCYDRKTKSERVNLIEKSIDYYH